MAFTNVQKTLSYELLGLFEGGTFDWFTYSTRITGVITSVPVKNQIDFTTATTRLEAIFTAIEAASDNREVRVGEILSEYSDVSLDSAEVKVGGGGGMPGARYNPDKHRAHLRRLLWTHLGIRVQVSSAGQGGIEGITTGLGSRMIGVSR